jgi:hypothetical protein
MQTQSQRIINSLIVARMNEIEDLTGEILCDSQKDLEVECIEAMDSNSVAVKNSMIAKLNSIIDLLNS